MSPPLPVRRYVVDQMRNHVDCKDTGDLDLKDVYAPRAVQLHPNGGYFDSARPPARTPHVGPQYVCPMWALSTCHGAYAYMRWRNQENTRP